MHWLLTTAFYSFFLLLLFPASPFADEVASFQTEMLYQTWVRTEVTVVDGSVENRERCIAKQNGISKA